MLFSRHWSCIQCLKMFHQVKQQDDSTGFLSLLLQPVSQSWWSLLLGNLFKHWTQVQLPLNHVDFYVMELILPFIFMLLSTSVRNNWRDCLKKKKSEICHSHNKRHYFHVTTLTSTGLASIQWRLNEESVRWGQGCQLCFVRLLIVTVTGKMKRFSLLLESTGFWLFLKLVPF